MKNFRGVIALFIVSILLSCDAPRLNPLDPLNPDYKLVQIDGFVKTVTEPSKPIAGVKVYWKNQNILVETDAYGYYKIENLPMKDGTMVFEKEGYSSKDTLISLPQNQKSKRVDIFLNAIPKLDSLSIYTIVLNRYSVRIDSIFVQAQVSDAEGDVDSVFIRSAELNFYRQLKFNSSKQFYRSGFSPFDLNLPSIEEGIGKDFEIVVKDRKKQIFSIGVSNIKRIINQEVLPKSPLNKQIVGTKPTLMWYRPLLGFNFKYTVQIYTDEIAPVLIWEKQNIPKNDVETVPTINLIPGDYNWVVWIIDDYQNRSRSKPASFVVQ
ncbi:MAG: carboxypeptidase-like regulatory domain-containing protein [Bacteroidota bacterium]